MANVQRAVIIFERMHAAYSSPDLFFFFFCVILHLIPTYLYSAALVQRYLAIFTVASVPSIPIL